MQKDFQTWCHVKDQKNSLKDIPYFYQREIWFVSCGVNIGFEQDGKWDQFQRPVLIIKKFNKYIFWGIPLSTTKKNWEYYVPFSYKDGITSQAIISQIRLFDSKRLIKKDGVLNRWDFEWIRKKLIQILESL